MFQSSIFESIEKCTEEADIAERESDVVSRHAEDNMRAAICSWRGVRSLGASESPPRAALRPNSTNAIAAGDAGAENAKHRHLRERREH